MTAIDDIYSPRLFEIASDMPRTLRFAQPDAKASAHSKLCGSTIDIDLVIEGDRIMGYGQTVKACLLGQASAAIVGRVINGTQIAEFHEVARQMRAMLKEGGPPPSGKWADLALLQPVKDYKARHGSVLLVFEAIEKALAEIEAKRAAAAAPEATAAQSRS